MFEHSVKVPRLYKKAAQICKNIEASKANFKALIGKETHYNQKALYSLVVEYFKKRELIDKLFAKSKVLEKEPRLDPVLGKILTFELLWGKQKLPCVQAKPIQTILAFEQIFKAHLADAATEIKQDEDVARVLKPRYVRVNNNFITTEEAITAFQDEGCNLVRFTNKNNYNEFLETVKSLGPDDFMVDLHIPNLLIFHPNAEFYNHEAYKKGKIILQDKASCLPPYILSPEPGSIVLDMCAAPGVKTSQMSAMMENKGKIYSVEIDQERFASLENFIKVHDCTCVTPIKRDALTICSKECPKVEYILIDPSCSGSGLLSRLDVKERAPQDQKGRLEKLAGFQIMLLRHALTKFPSAKRVVYSTCSLNPEENEDVVRQVLETCSTFKLVSAKKSLNNIWANFGSDDFGDIGKLCLYARPEYDLTTGFFVALFERLQDGEENQFLNKNARLKIQKVRTPNMKENGNQGSEIISDGKMNKNRKKMTYTVDNLHQDNENLDGSLEEVSHKKKKYNEQSKEQETSEVIECHDSSDTKKKKKEKKSLPDSSLCSESNQYGEENKSAKKKRKTRQIDELNEDTELVEEKTGKKHKKQKLDKNIENNIENESPELKKMDQDQNVHLTENIEKKKEKRHKNKELKKKIENSSYVDLTEENYVSDCQIISTKTDEISKSNVNETVYLCGDENILSTEHVGKKKKKKKHNNYQENDISDSRLSIAEPAEANKRKANEVIDLICEGEDENVAITEDIGKKKEKKHKNKKKKLESDFVDNDLEHDTIDVTEPVVVKSKRKINEIDEIEDLSTLVVEESGRKKRKHKK